MTTEPQVVRDGVPPASASPGPPDPAAPAASRHRMVVGDDGYPALSLTLVLQGVPEPDEQDITPRIRQGSCTMQIRLEVPPQTAPPYVRSGRLALLDAAGHELAGQDVSGAGLTGALHAELDRDAALAVLAAVDGIGDSLSVSSVLPYRTQEPGGPVHLTGNWAAVYDLLPATGAEPVNLRLLFDQAIAAGVLVVTPSDRAQAAWPSFSASARAVLLDADGLVASRPSELFGIDLLVHSGSQTVEHVLEVTTPLRDVLGHCLDGRDRSRSIHLLSITADRTGADGSGGDPASGPAPVAAPRRVRSTPVPRDARTGSAALALDRRGLLATTSATLDIGAKPRGTLGVQLAAVEVKPHAAGQHAAAWPGTWRESVADQDLPVVADPAATVMAGRSGATGWYAPAFELVAPRADQDATTSPFVFSFRRVGATSQGQPGLEASVTVRLRRTVPAEAAAPMAAGTPLRPIPTDNAEVVLDLPFRDANGTDQRQRFDAEVTWDGEVAIATVRLLDVWARLAYGALSQPGFQRESARVALTWSFAGLERHRIDVDTVVWGGKTAVLPTRFTTGAIIADPLVDPPQEYLEAATGVLRSPVGKLQLTTQVADASRVRRSAPGLLVNTSLVAPAPDRLEGLRPVGAGFKNGPTTPFPRPRPGLQTWVQGSYLRSQVLDLLVPCAQFGSCYVEQRTEGLVAVGCQDALQLGQASWRQYESIPELATPQYQVLRSLQQPGHFLLLPARYVVGRYPTDHPQTPGGPAILLYALLDPDNPATNQVVIQASLVPDVPPYALQQLLARLRGYAPAPVLTTASDVECTASFVWTVLGIPSVQVPTVLAPGGVSFTLQSDLAHTLLLRDMLTRDGIAGTMTVRLPDGTQLSSALLAGLSDLSGPRPRGPVDVSVSGSLATLVNRVERPVDVDALLVDEGGVALTEVAVERSLNPGQTATVDLGPATGSSAVDPSRCWPSYTVPPTPPAALQEIRSYVEDIRMNVVFVDLIDHASHGLSRLDLRAQLVDASAVQDVAMTGAPASGSASFVLPLTRYLQQRIVRYQATITRLDGSTDDSGWLTWDVAAAGCLISVTWPGLGFG